MHQKINSVSNAKQNIMKKKISIGAVLFIKVISILKVIFGGAVAKKAIKPWGVKDKNT